MKNQKALAQSAGLYDLLYSWKDYRGEAEIVRRLIQRNKRSPGDDLLEIACGTGEHARYLKHHFSIVATDINPKMLSIARKKVRGVTFRRADMLSLNLAKQFDVVLCLFSSIGYMRTTAELRAALHNFARHLKTGGLVVIEPWFLKSQFKVDAIHVASCGTDTIKVVRVSVSRVRGRTLVLDMHHMFAEQGKSVKYFVERHEMGMFEKDEFLRCIEKSGFRAKFLKSGFKSDRGLFIGIKR